MRISVVIPTHNRKALLRRCLTAVTHQNYAQYEVIVVDDGSTDGTGDMVRQEFPQVRYIRQDPNQGPAAARNRGIEAATGEIVAFTDDDCIVPTDWLTALVQGFRRRPEVAGVGGYQEAPEEILQTNTVARAERAMRLRRWGERAEMEQLGGNKVPGLGTNNVAFRRDVLLKVGGFDEGFPVAAGEDADLKLRIARRSYRLFYIPLKVEHHREYTLRAQWRVQVRRGIGVYYFEAKHRKAPGLGRVPLRFLKRTVLFLLDLRTLPWDVAGVIYLSGVANCVGQLVGRFAKPSGNSARGQR